VPEIEIPGGRLHYATSGGGQPILLIPGLGMDHTYYRLGAPLLSRHLQALAVDPRGIGRSTKSPPPYSVEDWADDFAVMIDRLGFGPIHVLGSSLGGAMALALAQRHPDKLKSLIVVGGFSEIDRAPELNFRLRLRLIERLGMSDEVADYMGLWTLPGNSSTPTPATPSCAPISRTFGRTRPRTTARSSRRCSSGSAVSRVRSRNRNSRRYSLRSKRRRWWSRPTTTISSHEN